MDNETAQQFWNKAGADFAEIADHEFGWTHLVTPYLKEHALRYPYTSLLDIGCGTGRALTVFKDSENYLGIDWSVPLVTHAQKTYPDRKILSANIEDPAAYPEKPEFDCALALNVLQDHKNPESALKNAYKALKGDGVLHVIIEHPIRTCRLKNTQISEATQAFKSQGLDHAYNTIFTYESGFISPEAPIMGWHRPLSFYFATMCKARFTLESFHELSISPTHNNPEILKTALDRNMVAQPVFAAFILRK